jgi:hypothetical protein
MLTRIISFWHGDRIFATRQLVQILALLLISTPLFLLVFLLLLRLLR